MPGIYTGIKKQHRSDVKMITEEQLETYPMRGAWGEIEYRNGYAYHKSFGLRVLFAVHVTPYEWRVFIDGTTEDDHRNALLKTLQYGQKLMEEDARHHFGAIAEWADEVGLKYRE
jgi:hypothetical protein